MSSKISKLKEFDYSKVRSIKEALLKAKTYADVCKVFKFMSNKTSERLMLLPDAKLPAKINHLLNVCDFVLEREKDKTILGYEGFSVYDTQSDFDVLVKLNDFKILAIDLTANPNLIQPKIEKMKTLAKSIESEIRDRGFFVSVDGTSVLTKTNYNVNVALPNSKSVKFEKSYDLIKSINKNNIDRLKAKSKTFLDAYTDRLLNIENKIELESDSFAVEDADLWSNIAKMNGPKIIRDYQIASKDLDHKTFEYKCYNVCRKLAEIYKEGNVRKYILAYRPCALSNNLSINNLSSLEANPIIKSLKLIYDNEEIIGTKFAWVTEDYDIKVADRPTDIFAPSGFVLVGRIIKKEHLEFEIFFNPDYIDSNLIDAIRRKNNTDTANMTAGKYSKRYYVSDYEGTDDITAAEEKYTRAFNTVVSSTSKTSTTSYFSKISTILNNSITTATTPLDISAASYIKKLLNSYKDTTITNIIEHEHEIAKAFCITTNVPPKTNTYRMVFNSSFKSITIRQSNSTLDSFTNSFYFVVYEPTMAEIEGYSRAIFSETEKVIQSESSSFNRNTLSWALRKAATTFMFATWLEENKLPGDETDQAAYSSIGNLVNSYVISSINRDSFAQVSEQVRYLFVSTTGRLSKPSEILAKFDNYRPRNLFEVVYLIRTMKMSAALYRLKASSSLSKIRVIDEEGDPIFCVAMPHERIFVPNFNYTISSFYVCNIFNKFKYNTMISEAICYEGLIEEDTIFKKAYEERVNTVIGLSSEVFALNNITFETILDRYATVELDYCIELSTISQKRYSSSLTLMLAVFITYSDRTNQNESTINERMRRSIIDSCTLRGAMSGVTIEKKSQSVRAASSILEGILRSYGVSVDDFNSKILYQQGVIDDLSDCSVSLGVLAQIVCSNKMLFAYRIVHKDQKGHREISVLNFAMRIAARFLEEMSRSISPGFEQNVLENPNKAFIMQDATAHTMKESKKGSIKLFDNNDQKRWGPNHLVHTFYAMMHVNLIECEGWLSIAEEFFKSFETKVAKYPEGIAQNILDNIMFDKRKTIGKFMDKIKFNVLTGVFGQTLCWGMCQGILHETSSVYHSIMANFVDDILVKRNIVYSIRTLVTSDDSHRSITLSRNVESIVELRRIFNIIIGVSSNFNIIRSLSKSCFNTTIAEFNSDFYVNGNLYTPNLKQRISKIDCGLGSDYVEDITNALAASNQYYYSGGTYVSAILQQIVNITFVTEQWRRWYQYSKGVAIGNSVMAGGLPVISPFITATSGPLGNILIKDLAAGYADENTLTRYITYIATQEPEFVTQEDLIRGNTTVTKDFYFKYLQKVSLSGLISLTKPTRHASKFLRRHDNFKTTVRDNNISIDRMVSTLSNLILHLQLGVGSTSIEENEGTNSIISRFAEPYIAIDALKFRVLKGNSIMNEFFKSGEKTSLRELESMYERADLKEVFTASYKKNWTTVNTNSATIALHLAEIITNSMNIITQSQSKGIKYMLKGKSPAFTINKLAINQVTVLDEETYKITLFNSLAKEKAKTILLNMGYSMRTIEELNEIETPEANSIKDAINIVTTASQSLGKYMKAKTKGVFKVGRKTKDLYQTIVDSMYYNFTSIVSLKPPKLKLPSSGKILKLAHSDILNVVTNNADAFVKYMTKYVIPNIPTSKNPIYLSYKDRAKAGSFTTISDSLELTDEFLGDVLTIKGGSVKSFRRKLDAIIPTNTPFKLDNRLVRDFDLNEFCVTGSFKFNNSFVNLKPLKTCPFTYDEDDDLGYTIEIEDFVYQHTLFIRDIGGYFKMGTKLNLYKRELKASAPDWLKKLSESTTNLINVSIGENIKISDKDLIRVIPINSTTNYSLAYSTTSMTVCLNFSGAYVPFASLPIDKFEPERVFKVSNYDYDELEDIKDGISKVFDVFNDDKRALRKFFSILNKYPLPMSDEIYEEFITDFVAEVASKVRKFKNYVDSFRKHKDTVLFYLLIKIPGVSKDLRIVKGALYKSNFCKPAGSILFRDITAREEVLEEEVEGPIRTVADEEAIKDFENQTGSVLRDLKFDPSWLISSAEESAGSGDDDGNSEFGESYATISTRVKIDEMGIAIDTEEVTENLDDAVKIEHEAFNYSIHHNYTDRNYHLAVEAIMEKIVEDLSPINNAIFSVRTLKNFLTNIKGTPEKLAVNLEIIKAYISLDRLAIMILTTSSLESISHN